MADILTLDQLEVTAAQLPPAERLQLVERICEQLKETLSGVRIKYPPHPMPIEDYIALCEEVAMLTPDGEFDSAADLRKLREEE